MPGEGAATSRGGTEKGLEHPGKAGEKRQAHGATRSDIRSPDGDDKSCCYEVGPERFFYRPLWDRAAVLRLFELADR